ncbi:MAG TPA: LamG-like jellyroll fold domain-containing protein [Chitinophagales bacterium]|nr:LamG-like jellyroll fold domain-containing protein [Chitinophagales bacterium]
MKEFFTLTLTFSFSVSLFAQLSPTSLCFDGSDVVTDEQFWQAHPPFGTGDFTIEAWIRDEAPANNSSGEVQTIIVTGDVGLNDGFLVYVGNGQLAADAAGGYLFPAGPELRDSACHHVAIVKSGYELRGYVDGTSVSYGWGVDTFTTTLPIQIGNALPFVNDAFIGLIKEVRLWNVARTQTEIQNNMNTVLSFQSALIGYWRCNEGTGFNVYNYAGNTTAQFGNLTYGGGSPDWSSGCPCSCVAPTNPNTTNITSTKAKLNWNTNDCAVGYRIHYKQSGGTWMTNNVSSNIGYKTIKGLLPNTSYMWKVKTKCTAEPVVYSPWSSSVSFNTTMKLEEMTEKEEATLHIFPNPASGNVSVEIDNSSAINIVMIQDLVGRILLEKNFYKDANDKVKMDVSTLQAGVYFLTTLTNEGRRTKIFVKQ